MARLRTAPSPVRKATLQTPSLCPSSGVTHESESYLQNDLKHGQSIAIQNRCTKLTHLTDVSRECRSLDFHAVESPEKQYPKQTPQASANRKATSRIAHFDTMDLTVDMDSDDEWSSKITKSTSKLRNLQPASTLEPMVGRKRNSDEYESDLGQPSCSTQKKSSSPTRQERCRSIAEFPSIEEVSSGRPRQLNQKQDAFVDYALDDDTRYFSSQGHDSSDQDFIFAGLTASPKSADIKLLHGAKIFPNSGDRVSASVSPAKPNNTATHTIVDSENESDGDDFDFQEHLEVLKEAEAHQTLGVSDVPGPPTPIKPLMQPHAFARLPSPLPYTPPLLSSASPKVGVKSLDLEIDDELPPFKPVEEKTGRTEKTQQETENSDLLQIFATLRANDFKNHWAKLFSARKDAKAACTVAADDDDMDMLVTLKETMNKCTARIRALQQLVLNRHKHVEFALQRPRLRAHLDLVLDNDDDDEPEALRDAARKVNRGIAPRDAGFTMIYCIELFLGKNKKNKQDAHVDLAEAGAGSDFDRNVIERLFHRLLMDDVFTEHNVANRRGFVAQYLKLGQTYKAIERSTTRVVMQVPLAGDKRGKKPKEAQSEDIMETPTRKQAPKTSRIATSTYVSSPVQGPGRSRSNTKGKQVQAYDSDDGFIVREDDHSEDDVSEEDAFEPVRQLRASKGRAPTRHTREESFGPPITSDERLQALDDIHQSMIENFVGEARLINQKRVLERSLREVPFTDTILREMAISFPLTKQAMCEIPDIDPDKVELHGDAYFRLIKQTKIHLDQARKVDGDRPNDPNRYIIDLVDSEDEGGGAQASDPQSSADATSSYFAVPADTAAFNARLRDYAHQEDSQRQQQRTHSAGSTSGATGKRKSTEDGGRGGQYKQQRTSGKGGAARRKNGSGGGGAGRSEPKRNSGPKKKATAQSKLTSNGSFGISAMPT
ncbi:hypothetical protein FH972_022736 [Carpinus fangiana]|uniref:DNA 3'-5' helicase n=1 Tax=Carpinus fangiana TaxID=176857 RepID=A0A5N6KTL5_9ROSI|nr:hypothetical protein FH972_022736 [Carpinus fangiana]